MQISLLKKGSGASLTLCAVALSLTALSPVSVYAQTYTGQVIANGLFNPRGLTFGADGSLYVAEAGRGGNGPSIVDGAGDTVSYGATSGLTRIQNGVQTRLLGDLPSLASQTGTPPGGGATGLHDVAFGADGNLYGVIGFGTDPAIRDTLTANGAPGANFGRLVRFGLGDTPSVTYLADISAFETSANPDGVPGLNSNPYGLTATPNGFIVADAGGNSLVNVDADGITTSLRAALPATPNPIFDPNQPQTGGPTYQYVPTSTTLGPGGTLFVAGLSGYPFVVGGANIYSVSSTGDLTVLPGGGFTNLIDLIYSPLSGDLYGLQLTSNGLASPTGPGAGQLIRINPTTGARTTIYDGLAFPGGVTQGADGAFYVTNLSVAPGGGQVIRIAAAPEPGSLGLMAGASLVAVVGVIRRRRK